MGTGDFLITAGGGFPTLRELDFKVFGVSGTAALDSSAAGGDCNSFAGSVVDELEGFTGVVTGFGDLGFGSGFTILLLILDRDTVARGPCSISRWLEVERSTLTDCLGGWSLPRGVPGGPCIPGATPVCLA